MILAEWQARLFAHFADLRKNRPSNQSIYGLEHGLSRKEIDDLEQAVRAAILDGYEPRTHWLPLVIYAAEIGYRYTGDEYWTTFSEETPGWNTWGDREWIRSSFRKFSKEFGGMKPSGAWANNFSIICWPITHAILPKDLQRELARILYESRHTFTPKLLRSAEELGRHIARRSSNTSSRFRKFAEEHLLLGQISVGLLFHGQRESDSQIFSTTLQRIVEDLETEQRSKAWLDDAQRKAREIRLRGLTRGKPGLFESPVTKWDDEADLETALDVRLLLFPDNEKWNVFLEFVNLSRLVDFEPLLATARPKINGINRNLGRGWHLYDSRIQLDFWPGEAGQLLSFEPHIQDIEALLSQHPVLPAGSPGWVLKLRNDGFAKELRGRTVRPGNDYIYLATHEVSIPGGVSMLQLSCDGLIGFKLGLPPVIPESMLTDLMALGLTVGTSVSVWPAGLPAVVWDGEGYSEWSAPIAPCLGIKTDTTEPMTMTIELEGKDECSSMSLSSAQGCDPVFIELPGLQVGEYHLRIAAEHAATGSHSVHGYLRLHVREPELWNVVRHEQIPLFVSLNPSAPTLEEFWENRCSVEMHGPASLPVVPELFLESKGNVLFKKRLPPLTLPVEVESWKQHFYKHILKDAQAQSAYDQCHQASLAISIKQFGSVSLNFTREFIETRWIFRRSGQTRTLSLMDESDTESQNSKPAVYTYGFQTPDARNVIVYESAIRGIILSSTGGLFAAIQGGRTHATIAPPEIHGLQDLRVTPRLTPRIKSAGAISEFFELYEMWATAHVSGGFEAVLRQRDVLEAIQLAIIHLLGGRRWFDAEQRYRAGSQHLTDLRSEISGIASESQIGAEVEKIAMRLSTMTINERVYAFATLLRQYFSAASSTRSSSGEEVFAELALRVTSFPLTVREWAGQRFQPGIEWLLRSPAIVRAARFFVLAVEATRPRRVQAVPLYSAWEWA